MRAAEVRREHPYRWLWEPLEEDPGFALSPMFGGKSAYIDGRLTLFFIAKQAPWRGVLVCTDKARQALLTEEFPGLSPHPVLKKWLYLPEGREGFEREVARLVGLAAKRDARIGVLPSPRKRRQGA